MDRGDVHLAYEQVGEAGDPVVLIHGGWDDHRTWTRVVPGLAGAVQLLVYDRRGHGASSGPDRALPVRDDAADLAEVLVSTGLFPAHLVGHTFGGVVALRLAVDRPELVRSVAVFEVPFVGLLSEDPPGRSGDPVLAERLRQLREKAARGPGDVAAQEYLAVFGAPGVSWSTVEPTSRAAFSENARVWAGEMGDPEATAPNADELHAVAVPVLALAGGRSPPFAARIHDRLVAELPNATAVVLPEAGHLPQRTEPDLLVGVLGTFLLERNVPST